MKIETRMRKRGFWAAKIAALVVGVIIAAGMVPMMLRVKAAGGEVKDVEPGNGTLKAAVEAANEGDTLRLKAGSYTGDVNNRTVEIKKGITIEGVGSYLDAGGRTVIDVPIEIKTDQQVTLKNFTSNILDVEPNFVYFKVTQANAKLTLDNVTIWGIMRGSNGGFASHDATMLDITAEADGAQITVNGGWLSKPGTRYGIRNQASNTTVDLNRAEVTARTAIAYENGSGNKLNVNEGTQVIGPSPLYREKEVVLISGQENLAVTIDKGEIRAVQPLGNGATKMFALSDSTTDTTVEVKNGGKLVDQDPASTPFMVGSVIWGLPSEAKAADSNVLKLDATSKMYISKVDGKYQEVEQTALVPEREYAKISGGAVIGLTDGAGARIAKVYDNGSTISELTEETYTKLEGKIFRGWFKNFDGKVYSEEFTDAESKTAVSGEVFDLYPKFVEAVKVHIGEQEIDIETGQMLGEGIKDLEAKLEVLKKEEQNLKGYIVRGEKMNQTFQIGELESMKKFPVTEELWIEAIHDVTLKVNEEEFTLEAGTTIGELSEEDQERYKTARLNDREEKYFARLVYVNGGNAGQDFDETAPVNVNTEIKTKHYLGVTVDSSEEYLVEEGETIAGNAKLMAKLKEIAETKRDDKTFEKFVDGDGTEVAIDGTYIVLKATTISAKYTVEVKIGDGEGYKLPENGKLSELKKDDEIKQKLYGLADEARELDFHGFAIGATGGAVYEGGRLEATTKEAVDAQIAVILQRKIPQNSTIFAEFKASVTIKCTSDDCGEGWEEGAMKFGAIDTGKTLEDVASEDATRYEKAKYQEYSGTNKKEKRFSRFVDEETGETITETAEITKSMTIRPLYNAFVTIDDEREEIAGEFTVEKGAPLEALVGEDGNSGVKALEKLRSDIPDVDVEVGALEGLGGVPEAAFAEGEELHFEKIVMAATKDADEPTEVPEETLRAVNEDLTIAGLYHYDVIIVEDYDEPNKPEEGDTHEGSIGFTIYRNKGLSSKKDEIDAALAKLEESATSSEKGRKFLEFIETSSGERFSDTNDQNADKAYNRHLYIDAVVEYEVMVGEAAPRYVEEGTVIGEDEGLLEAIAELDDMPGKKVDAYVLNGEEMSREALLLTSVTERTEIKARYSEQEEDPEQGGEVGPEAKAPDSGGNGGVQTFAVASGAVIIAGVALMALVGVGLGKIKARK